MLGEEAQAWREWRAMHGVHNDDESGMASSSGGAVQGLPSVDHAHTVLGDPATDTERVDTGDVGDATVTNIGLTGLLQCRFLQRHVRARLPSRLKPLILKRACHSEERTVRPASTWPPSVPMSYRRDPPAWSLLV